MMILQLPTKLPVSADFSVLVSHHQVDSVNFASSSSHSQSSQTISPTITHSAFALKSSVTGLLRSLVSYGLSPVSSSTSLLQSLVENTLPLSSIPSYFVWDTGKLPMHSSSSK